MMIQQLPQVALAALLWVSTLPADAAVVVSREIFYNHSVFDGLDPAANAADDGAIALDKSVLLPGQTSSFANYTNYFRGMNGVMIDIEGLPITPSLADFSFAVGNSVDVGDWTSAPTPISISTRPTPGVSGSTRVTLIWDDNAIFDQWLQISALTTLGLPMPDVFYVGNLTADVNGDGRVSAVDSLILINDLNNNGPRVTGIDDPFDLDRDRGVNASDALIAIDYVNQNPGQTLVTFTAPGGNIPVPAPVTLALMGLGLAGIWYPRRKR